MENVQNELDQLADVYTSNDDYVRACSDAISALGEMEIWRMDKTYEIRRRALEEKIFLIIEHCVNEMYDETVGLEENKGEPDS